jgi:hypothetical protein
MYLIPKQFFVWGFLFPYKMKKIINAALSSTTILICLILVYNLSMTNLFEDRLFGTRRLILTILLVIYAVFRMYKVYRLLKNK